jgi:hypothetical protein
LLQPILDKAGETGEIQIEDPTSHDFLGFVCISIYWRDLLTDLLSPGSNGIVIVFENECNPSFTYEVNGPDVVYLGRGDLHDSKYDSAEIGVSNLCFHVLQSLSVVTLSLTKFSRRTGMASGSRLVFNGQTIVHWLTSAERHLPILSPTVSLSQNGG